MKTRTLLALHCVAHRGQRVRNVACNVCTSVLTVHWVSGPSCQCTRRTAQSLVKTPGCHSVSDHNIHHLTIASVTNVSATPWTLMVTRVLMSGVTRARVRCAEYAPGSPGSPGAGIWGRAVFTAWSWHPPVSQSARDHRTVMPVSSS